MNWHPIETAPRDGRHGKLIVTNNLNAMDSFGHMSHAWLVSMIHDEDNEVIAYTDNGLKIRYLSHWMPLPEPPQ